MSIMSCINQFVTDDKIKVIAHRVLWLGNDHAHYLKFFKNKSLEDLKTLIYLTLSWIDIHEELIKINKQAEKIEKRIPHGGSVKKQKLLN